MAAVVDETVDTPSAKGARPRIRAPVTRLAESSKAVGYLKGTVEDSNFRKPIPFQHLRNRVARVVTKRAVHGEIDDKRVDYVNAPEYVYTGVRLH